MKPEFNNCNLCNKKKELIKKSHIIPDFFFSNLYNEKHRLIKFDVVKMFNGNSKTSSPPTSIYEKNILCKKCDNEIINLYESYYAKIYHQNDFVNKINPKPNKLNHHIYQNLDFNKANIFFLTILWRASISSMKEFKNVDLNKDLSENIRNQILNGKYDENSVRITGFKLNENSNLNRSVTQFKKFDNHYGIILEDLFLFFHIRSNVIYEQTKKHCIDRNGEWILPEIPKSYEQKFIMSFINPIKNVW